MKSKMSKNKYLIEYLSVIAVSLIFGVLGLLVGTLGPMLPIIESEGYHDIPPVSRAVSSMTITTLNMGIGVGSIISSYMNEILGRKCAMILTTIPQVLSYLTMYFANDVYMIYASCFLRGIYCAMAYALVPSYVGEITSAKVRGPSTVFGLLLLPVGGLIGGIVQSLTSISRTAIIMGVLSICTVPFLFLIPESPYYYMSKKRDNECKNVLKRLRRSENIEKDFVDIQITWKEMEKSKNVSWAELFTNKFNFRILLIVIGVLLVQQCTGYAPLFAYCTVYINETEFGLSLLVITLMINSVGITSTAASLFTVESLGRRILFFIICTMATVGLGIVGSSYCFEQYIFESTGFKIQRIFGMLLLMSSFAYGIGFFPNLLAAELFSSDIKAKGVSMLLILQAIAGVAVTLTYDQLYSIEKYLPFFVCIILTVIGIVFGYFFIPETKNKTLAEIQKELNLKT